MFFSNDFFWYWKLFLTFLNQNHEMNFEIFFYNIHVYTFHIIIFCDSLDCSPRHDASSLVTVYVIRPIVGPTSSKHQKPGTCTGQSYLIYFPKDSFYLFYQYNSLLKSDENETRCLSVFAIERRKKWRRRMLGFY